jgi:hypothetical protein
MFIVLNCNIYNIKVLKSFNKNMPVVILPRLAAIDDVNAECCMAHGSSTFEESKSFGSSVYGIGETLCAGNWELKTGISLPISLSCQERLIGREGWHQSFPSGKTDWQGGLALPTQLEGKGELVQQEGGGRVEYLRGGGLAWSHRQRGGFCLGEGAAIVSLLLDSQLL